MSLIDEALKRARMEAAQRAAESEGLPYPAIPRHLGPPRKRPVWLAVIALLLAVAGGVALGRWLAAGPPPGPPSAEVARPAAPAQQAGAAPATPVASEEPGRPAAAAATATPTAPPSSAAPPETARRESAVAVQETPPQRSPAPPAAAAVPTRPAPSAAAEPGRDETTAPVTDPDSGLVLVLPDAPPAGAGGDEAVAERFLQEVTLPDGSAIELGGIAWSENGPFALINGRVVGPGTAVGRYTVETIGPEHVLLAGEGRRIRIDLR